MQPNTQDAFDQLVSANSDVAVSMHAMYMLRRLRSLGILAEYIQKDGVFSHLRVPANDGARLEIRPQTLRTNDVVTTQPMMQWNEYPESLREFMEKAGKPTGYYRYNAQIELIVDDYEGGGHRFYCATVAVGSKIFVFGGGSTDGTISNRTWDALDVSTMEWASATIPEESRRLPRDVFYGGQAVLLEILN